MGSDVEESSKNDIEVEPGKRVTIRLHGGWVPSGSEVILVEEVVDEIVRQWLDLPEGTTRGDLIDGVLEGYEGRGSEADESEES